MKIILQYFYKKCKKMINIIFETFTCRVPPEYVSLHQETDTVIF